MRQPRSSRKTLALSVLLLAFCLGELGLAPGAQAAEDPLKMVPDNCLFCVRINNPDAAMGQVDLFLTGLLPMGVSMMAKAQLGQVLGSPDAKGLNMAGNIVLFGPLPGGAGPDPTRIGILIPVSDYQQFVGGNPNVSDADAMGISKINVSGGPILATIPVGGYALASTPGNEQALVDMKKSVAGTTAGLAAKLDAAELKRAQTAPVWAYANVQLAGQMFGPLIQAKLQEAKQGFEEMKEQGGPMMGNLGGVMDMYAGLIDTMMKETKFVSLSLEPSANMIRLAFVAAAMPGTDMAKMLAGGAATQQGADLRGYLQDGAMMNFQLRADYPAMREFGIEYTNLISSLTGGDIPEEEAQKLKTLTTNMMDAMGGPIVFSMAANPKTKPPFAMKYVLAVKDKEKFYDSMEKMTEWMTAGGLTQFYKQMGLEMSYAMTRKSDSYQGVAIDSVKFALKSTDTESPQGQMIANMYGEGFEGRLALVNGLCVQAIGGDCDKGIRDLIDQAKAGGPKQTSSEVQAAMQLIPGAEKADFFATYNYLRLMQMVTAMMPMPMPQMDIPTQSNIAMAGTVGNGGFKLEMAVPKQHVLEVMMVFMKMQQQKMQQSQGQM
ncbi:MAG: hypothetical protein JW741_06795 [Sedimentisphaerales bacterium]|nr:hypothetical protein [Sedimentisphaerales bacterium]